MNLKPININLNINIFHLNLIIAFIIIINIIHKIQIYKYLVFYHNILENILQNFTKFTKIFKLSMYNFNTLYTELNVKLFYFVLNCEGGL